MSVKATCSKSVVKKDKNAKTATHEMHATCEWDIVPMVYHSIKHYILTMIQHFNL